MKAKQVKTDNTAMESLIRDMDTLKTLGDYTPESQMAMQDYLADIEMYEGRIRAMRELITKGGETGMGVKTIECPRCGRKRDSDIVKIVPCPSCGYSDKKGGVIELAEPTKKAEPKKVENKSVEVVTPEVVTEKPKKQKGGEKVMAEATQKTAAVVKPANGTTAFDFFKKFFGLKLKWYGDNDGQAHAAEVTKIRVYFRYADGGEEKSMMVDSSGNNGWYANKKDEMLVDDGK